MAYYNEWKRITDLFAVVHNLFDDILMIFNVLRPSQEAQKIFKATGPMENAAIKTKLLGFGMQLLEGIDPNPDNFVCAAIIHTRSQQIGCLLRLEPNRQAQVSNMYNSF